MIDRREEILNAVEILVKEHGAKGVTVDDLCGSISISKKTFYRYFSSKHEVMIALVQSLFKNFEQLLEAETNTIADPIQKLQKIYELFVDGILSYNPKLVDDLKAYYKESHEARIEFSQKLTDYLSNMIRHGQSKKVFRSDVDPKVVSRLLIRETESLWSRMFTESIDDLRQEQEELFEIILAGIRKDS